MKRNDQPVVFVVGNEKGGAGKTTCSMHLIIGLLEKGYNVASIDADPRQHSLTNYITNRQHYNHNHPNDKVKMPLHFCLQDICSNSITDKEMSETSHFEQVFSSASVDCEYIVIDTPGSYTHFSRIAHSYADTIITPINDSFVDLDVMAEIHGADMQIIQPSIYSQMVWEQKMARASRDGKSIDWVVLRNRLSNLDARNKRNITDTLARLAKRIHFKIVPGFSERVIFRELFPIGLTLFDIKPASTDKLFNISHVTARQELRDFFHALGLNDKLSK